MRRFHAAQFAHLPADFLTVFRIHVRKGNPVLQIVFGTALTGAAVVLSHVLESQQNPFLFVGEMSHFNASWQHLETILICLLFCTLAAALGGFATPQLQEHSDIQAQLVSRLSALAICMGRLFALMLIPISGIVMSCLFFLVIGRNVPNANPDGLAEPVCLPVTTIATHLSIATFAIAFGAISFTVAIRKLPGRNLLRGALVSGTLLAACTTSVVAGNLIFAKMDQPTRLINTSLAINPLICIASVFRIDILREEWIYNHTTAHDYEYSYPPVCVTLGLFVAVGMVSTLTASRKIRIAYS